jgi:Holliday junction resolvase
MPNEPNAGAPKKRGRPRKKGINSRAKGARGEREFAAYLEAHGLSAHRGQQFAGGTDSPDVVCKPLAHVHFEVKRKEAGSSAVYSWLHQADRDGGKDKLPVVVHRTNKNGWIAILPATDLLRLLILREAHLDECPKPIRFPGPKKFTRKPAAKILKTAEVKKLQAALERDPDADILGEA